MLHYFILYYFSSSTHCLLFLSAQASFTTAKLTACSLLLLQPAAQPSSSTSRHLSSLPSTAHCHFQLLLLSPAASSFLYLRPPQLLAFPVTPTSLLPSVHHHAAKPLVTSHAATICFSPRSAAPVHHLHFNSFFSALHACMHVDSTSTLLSPLSLVPASLIPRPSPFLTAIVAGKLPAFSHPPPFSSHRQLLPLPQLQLLPLAANCHTTRPFPAFLALGKLHLSLGQFSLCQPLSQLLQLRLFFCSSPSADVSAIHDLSCILCFTIIASSSSTLGSL